MAANRKRTQSCVRFLCETSGGSGGMDSENMSEVDIPAFAKVNILFNLVTQAVLS